MNTAPTVSCSDLEIPTESATAGHFDTDEATTRTISRACLDALQLLVRESWFCDPHRLEAPEDDGPVVRAVGRQAAIRFRNGLVIGIEGPRPLLILGGVAQVRG